MNGSPITVSRVPQALGRLLAYAQDRGLITAEDHVFTRNRILDVLGESDYDPALELDRAMGAGETIDDLLRPLLDHAVASGRLDVDTPTRRDLLDTAIMGALLERPSAVAHRFWTRYAHDPVAATDDFYRTCIDVNYIRKPRCDRNVTWQHPSRYGDIMMTINLSKPEKDPRDIASAATSHSDSYPKCMLCRENEAYAGRLDFPARQNLRLIPMELGAEPWFMQYSPYLYFSEHCIFLSGEHRPMLIDRSALDRLVQIVDMLPHYFVGANADLPIVGGSILSHDHFQGGRYEFPIQRARTFPIQRAHTLERATVGDVNIEVVDWPLTVIRLTSANPDALVRHATQLVTAWRAYSDESMGVFANTNGTPHNTVTPICRRTERGTQFDLVLRNNRTSREFPDGVFHPHPQIHPVKRENIGLIEVMGLAVLPPRLARDIESITKSLMTGDDHLSPAAAQHEPMVAPIRQQMPFPDDLAAGNAVRAAIADYFVTGLEHCGVFGSGQPRLAAIQRFLGFAFV